MKNIPQSQVSVFRDLIDYDPDAGRFSWRVRSPIYFGESGKMGSGAAYQIGYAQSWNKRLAGKQCFHKPNGKGHHHGTVFAVHYLSHRMAWALHFGEWPASAIDHVNGDGTDNRIANLRLVTPSQNQMNRHSMRGAGHIKGAIFHKGNGRWISNIRANGKRIHLGYFNTAEEAGVAYAAAAERYQGSYSLIASRGGDA